MRRDHSINDAARGPKQRKEGASPPAGPRRNRRKPTTRRRKAVHHPHAWEWLPELMYLALEVLIDILTSV